MMRHLCRRACLFVEASLTITGTPTQVEVVQVTFSVEDTDGDTASRQFTISVSEGDTEPTFAFEIPDYDLRVGSPFAVTLPGATGGNSPTPIRFQNFLMRLSSLQKRVSSQAHLVLVRRGLTTLPIPRRTGISTRYRRRSSSISRQTKRPPNRP